MRCLHILALAAGAFGLTGATGDGPRYAVTGAIAGPDGGWDYAGVDPQSRRLYVAHGTAVSAVDLATRQVTGSLAPANRPHEVLPIPGSGLLLVTEGGAGDVLLLDGVTGAEKGRIKVGENPDAAIWDARRSHAIIMNAKSGTVSVVDPRKMTVVATIQLAAGLEFAAFDEAGLLYVNNEDRNQIAIVDLDRTTVLGWVDLPGCDGPTGMAYAPTADRIVSACGNGKLVIVDPQSRKAVGSIAIGRGPDAVISDPARKRLFVPSGGAGSLAVLAEAPGKISLRQTVPTEASARTGAVDPTDGTVYLPAAKLQAPAQPGARSQPFPGSFHLIVVSPE